MPPDSIDHSIPSRRIAVDLHRLPWLRKLAIDYVHDFGALAPFYAGHPANRADWEAAVARARDRQSAAIRGTVCDIVAAQQRERGAPEEARAACERLRDSTAIAVVTGQQAGVFGGPLYTLLKAITTLQLARRVAHDHGVPAVAVFWIHAEDHDWEEVSSVGVLDAALELRRVVLAPPPGAGERPVGSVRLDGAIDGVFGELEATLSPTEFTASVLERLRAAYVPGRGMADAFGRWLEATLGRFGLVVFDAADPGAKSLVSPVFARELAQPGETAALAARAGAGLESRGYHAQVEPAEGSVALFYLDGARRAIQRRDDQYLAGAATLALPALQRTAVDDPVRFSPNVLLRPIVQDFLFPTVCYVAGPNELAYLGQLKDAYARFDVPMPLIHPRGTATLLDSAATRFLTRYEVPLESLQPRDEAVLNQLLAAQLPPEVEQSLQEAAEAIEARMSAVITAVPQIDPTLEGAARSTLGKLQHDLRTLHGKIIQAAKRRDETLRRQFSHAQALAFPGGQPQERALGCVYFLNRFGPALPDRLLEELPLDMQVHWVLTV